MVALVKSAAGPYVFNFRIGLLGSAAPYASAAAYVFEDVMKFRTCPWPNAIGREIVIANKTFRSDRNIVYVALIASTNVSNSIYTGWTLNQDRTCVCAGSVQARVATDNLHVGIPLYTWWLLLRVQRCHGMWGEHIILEAKSTREEGVHKFQLNL